MFCYKLIIAYDGTDYHGWQKQFHDHITVTQVLEDTFFKVFGKKISILGSSRTDAGVHAAGQVASFSTDIDIDPQQMRLAWNGRLPVSILIRSITRTEVRFNPMNDVAQKTYYYHVLTQRPLPFFSRYGYYYRWNIDIEKLRTALQVFVGTHDFRSFCTLYDKDKDTVRTIDSIEVVYMPRYKLYRIIVKGYSFLHFMIRRIVGACLEVASRDYLSCADLEHALAQKNPQQSLPKAPAHGLMLYKIRYKGLQ